MLDIINACIGAVPGVILFGLMGVRLEPLPRGCIVTLTTGRSYLIGRRS